MYVSQAHCNVRPSIKSRTTLLGSSCRSWSGGYGVRNSLRWKRLTTPFSLDFEGLRTRLPKLSISTHLRFHSCENVSKIISTISKADIPMYQGTGYSSRQRAQLAEAPSKMLARWNAYHAREESDWCSSSSTASPTWTKTCA